GEPNRPIKRPLKGPAKPAAASAPEEPKKKFKTAAASAPEEPKKKLPVLWIAIGGGVAAVLIVVVLVLALSGKPAPPPAPEVQEPTAAEKAKAAARLKAQEECGAREAKDAEAAARSTAELELLEKPVLEMIEWGNFKGAAAGVKTLPKASQERVRRVYAAAGEAKYAVMLRDSRARANRGKAEDGRGHLLQIVEWELAALGE